MTEANKLIKLFNLSEKVILFENLKTDPLLLKIKNVISNNNKNNNNKKQFSQIIYDLVAFSEANGLNGDLFSNYLKSLVMKSENPFSLTAEKKVIAKKSSLYQLALNDINIINQLFNIKSFDLLSYFKMEEYSYLADYKCQNNNPEKENLYSQLFNHSNPEKIIKDLNDFYINFGVSILNQSRAFYWQNDKLKIVNNPDKITFKEIIGYQKQKNRLIENSKSFINDKKAHNVLLYGDSGTGKSSSVKALLNKYFEQGLRLIEINSSQIKELPAILEYLSQRGLYFIIFMDDLSFEEFETDYKYLKAVMEGGIESKPDNVLFYATSNRRHLVREKWQDRESEIHENDILNEKLSLSERFGLTLMYNTPAQSEYLKIVRELAKQEKIKIKKEILEEKALKWSRWNNGRSGRTARQFINQLLKEDV